MFLEFLQGDLVFLEVILELFLGGVALPFLAELLVDLHGRDGEFQLVGFPDQQLAVDDALQSLNSFQVVFLAELRVVRHHFHVGFQCRVDVAVKFHRGYGGIADLGNYAVHFGRVRRAGKGEGGEGAKDLNTVRPIF